MKNQLKIYAVLFVISTMLMAACSKQEPIIDISEQSETLIENREDNECGGYSPIGIVASDCQIKIINLCKEHKATIEGQGFSWSCNGDDCKNSMRIEVPSKGKYNVKTYTRTGYLEKNVFINVHSDSCNGNDNGNNDSCQRPKQMNVTNIKKYEAKINWSGTQNTTQYQIKYKKKNTSNWKRKKTASTSKVIRQLDKDTVYKYKVRAKCNGNWTDWTSGKTFRTGS